MTTRQASRGVTAVEVILCVAVVLIILMYVMLSMPRSRESARRTTCQRNMMQIGMALGLYTQGDLPLPQVRYGEAGPLAQMLAELKQPDFMNLTDRKVAPKPARAPAGPQPVPGFVCPSDPSASDGSLPAPVSYRAATGDTPDGIHGAFEPGKIFLPSSFESGKGTGFIAAFSERMVGNSRDDKLASYNLVPGPLGGGVCPEGDASARKDDAGASWMKSTWADTLYQHAIPPNATPSCVASDGKSAQIGASSAHPEGVHLLMIDGSVKQYRPTVDHAIWRGLANTGVPSQ